MCGLLLAHVLPYTVWQTEKPVAFGGSTMPLASIPKQVQHVPFFFVTMAP